jgi:hypothetical protein
MSFIIYSGDDDEEAVWCDPPCDARLIERKDGSMICSYCCREYLPNSVNKHKRKLEPTDGRYYDNNPELIPLTDYGSYTKKKKPSVFDAEDRHISASRSGFSWTSHEDYGAEAEPKPKRI